MKDNQIKVRHLNGIRSELRGIREVLEKLTDAIVQQTNKQNENNKDNFFYNPVLSSGKFIDRKRKTDNLSNQRAETEHLQSNQGEA